eukprot:765144-Hanusia_phi.AAC.1
MKGRAPHEESFTFRGTTCCLRGRIWRSEKQGQSTSTEVARQKANKLECLSTLLAVLALVDSMVHFKSVVRVALLAVGSLSAVSGFLTPSPLGVRLQSSSSRAHARSSVSSLSMKVFDWKKRAALAADPSLADFKVGEENILGKLAPAPGSRRPKTRKGRGIAAGQGATCGFGMRGQKSRAGRPTR